MPWLRRAARLLPVFPLILFCLSCAGFWVSESSIQSVSVSPTTVILKAGATPPDTITLASTATTVGGTSGDDTDTASWSSSNTAVVTAAGKGVVTAASGAQGNQTATITAKDGGQSGTCSVLTYTGTAPSGPGSLNITFPAGYSTPGINTSFQVSAFTPSSAVFNGVYGFNLTQYVTWYSQQSGIATVSSTGVVTVQSSATAGSNFTITATATFSGGTATGSYQFTVGGNSIL